MPERPKALLEFGGRSLLARHLAYLHDLSIRQVTVCTGFEAAQLEAAVATCRRPAIHCVFNPNFTTGSIESLWAVRDALRVDEDVLVMDADVLYPFAVLERLAHSPHRRCLLLDRDYVPGDEPVKVCVRAGEVVDFSKQPDPTIERDFMGESIGFFRFDPTGARHLAALCEACVADGRRDAPHEAAIREMILAGDHGIGYEDVSGAPWIEIDFPEDIRRANEYILPAIDHARSPSLS